MAIKQMQPLKLWPEQLQITAVAVSVSAVLIYLGLGLLLRRGRPNSGNLPPGPLALPIIGHLHLIGDKPHLSLAQLARKYGSLMSLRLGSKLVVVASSPTMAKYVLQTYDSVMASRPPTTAARQILYNHTNIGFAPYGPYWKLMRRITRTCIFQPKCLECSKHVRGQEVHDLMHWVLYRGSEHTPIYLRAGLQEATNNVISRLTIGRKYADFSSDLSLDNSNMVELLNEIMVLVGAFNVSDYIPGIAFLDLQGYERRMKKAKRGVKECLGEIIRRRKEERKANAKAEQRDDMLDALLSVQNLQEDIKITDDNITAVIQDMYLGGTENSALTVEWALAELLTNPSAMQKVVAELDTVVGRDRLVQEDDLANLTYLHAVVNETFRLHPVAPLLLPRICSQNCKVGSYLIPEGAWVYVNTHAIGRDPGTWQDPLAFRPERFLRENQMKDVEAHLFALTPFGAGRRKCVGWELGQLNVSLMLSRLLQAFDLQLPPASQGTVDMSEKFGLVVTMATPLKVIAMPRLSQHLYDLTGPESRADMEKVQISWEKPMRCCGM